MRALSPDFTSYGWAPSTAEIAARTGLDPVQVVRFDGNVPAWPLPTSRPGALAGALADVHNYPHGGYTELTAAVGRYAKVAPENVVLGAGADDLHRIEPGPGRDLRGRRRPAVRREVGRQRSHRRTASAWAGMPSTAASASTTGRTLSSPFRVRRWTVTGFRKASRPRPPTARARPPVGRTWFPPVA